jgi:hypothetical protein
MKLTGKKVGKAKSFFNTELVDLNLHSKVGYVPSKLISHMADDD